MCSVSGKIWHFCQTKKKFIVIFAVFYLIVMFATSSIQIEMSAILHRSIRYIDNFILVNYRMASPPVEAKNGRLKNTIGITGVDIHYEEGTLGHTGDASEEHYSQNERNRRNRMTIAIGGAITSRGTSGVSEENMGKTIMLFTALLPTFCSTVSTGYSFQFYLAYDYSDPVLTNLTFLRAFHKTFTSISSELCPKDLEVGLHFVQCSHSGKPTWAQNDAMLEAYLDDVDYFYRINDDTKLSTKGWVEEFLKTLKSYDPPNVGVVGPNHSGGNTAILTYDFVHKTHVDIFGFYYPRLFTDWWGDDWVTGVYKPGRSTKLKHVRLAHTMTLGKRYTTHWEIKSKVGGQLEVDKKTLRRYILRIKNRPMKSNQKKFISMTLYGKDPKYTWGAIRNAQLMPIVFPQWTLRLYIPHPEFFPPNATNGTTSVPSRIVSKLKQLGAQILFVNSPSVPPKYWSYLITIDPEVDYFLIRNVESRISDRDAAAVSDWLERRDAEAVHCIRDHPKHANMPIVDGLWGGSTAKINQILKGKRLFEVVAEYFTNSSFTVSDYERGNQSDHKTTTEHLRNLDMLKDILWPIMSDYVLCHDSVSCDKWNNTLGFPVKREAGEFLGEKFDERQTSISDGFEEIKSSNPLCNGKGFYHLQESNSTQT